MKWLASCIAGSYDTDYIMKLDEVLTNLGQTTYELRKDEWGDIGEAIGQIEEDCRSTECDGNEGLSYKKCNCSKYEDDEFSQDDYDDIGEDYDFDEET